MDYKNDSDVAHYNIFMTVYRDTCIYRLQNITEKNRVQEKRTNEYVRQLENIILDHKQENYRLCCEHLLVMIALVSMLNIYFKTELKKYANYYGTVERSTVVVPIVIFCYL